MIQSSYSFCCLGQNRTHTHTHIGAHTPQMPWAWMQQCLLDTNYPAPSTYLSHSKTILKVWRLKIRQRLVKSQKLWMCESSLSNPTWWAFKSISQTLVWKMIRVYTRAEKRAKRKKAWIVKIPLSHHGALVQQRRTGRKLQENQLANRRDQRFTKAEELKCVKHAHSWSLWCLTCEWAVWILRRTHKLQSACVLPDWTSKWASCAW